MPNGTGEQHRIAGRRGVGVKRLHRVDEHAGDFLGAFANHVERRRVHVLQGEAVADGALAAEPRLHAVPPAVVGAGERHNESAAGVEAPQPHRGHDGFGAAHVERHLVEPGNRFEQRDVVGHQRVQRPENRSDVLHPFQALLHPFLVTLEAGHADPVGAAHVEAPMAVQVTKLWSLGRRHRRAQVEFLPYHPHERKRHAVGVGEAQVRETVADVIAPIDGFGVLGLKMHGQAVEGLFPALRPVRRGAVGAEKGILVVLAAFDPQRQVARQRGHQGSGAEGVNGVEEPASAAYQQPRQAERGEQEPAVIHL